MASDEIDRFRREIIERTGDQRAADNRADFAEELTEECTQIPENLARYIDYNAMAYDMEVGGDIFTIELAHGDVHIFWNH